MKCCSIVLAICCLILLPQCATRTPRAPGDAALSGQEASVYRRGYYHGLEDAKQSQDEDFEQHHAEFDSSSANAFERGYSKGYKDGRPQAIASGEDRDEAYNQGLELGKADYMNAQSPAYERHRAFYTAGSEKAFRLGYAEGYKQARSE